MILFVVAGSLAPARDIPVDMMHGTDKVVHFLGYFLLGLFAVMVFKQPRQLAFALAFLVVLGGIVEIAQGLLTQSRSADLLDFVVNTLGVAAATTLRGTKISRLPELLESRVR